MARNVNALFVTFTRSLFFTSFYMYLYLSAYVHIRTHIYMHVYIKYWDILAWFIMFIDIVIIVLLVAFTKISNDILLLS